MPITRLDTEKIRAARMVDPQDVFESCPSKPAEPGPQNCEKPWELEKGCFKMLRVVPEFRSFCLGLLSSMQSFLNVESSARLVRPSAFLKYQKFGSAMAFAVEVGTFPMNGWTRTFRHEEYECHWLGHSAPTGPARPAPGLLRFPRAGPHVPGVPAGRSMDHAAVRHVSQTSASLCCAAVWAKVHHCGGELWRASN